MAQVSVVIPVYNIAAHLEQCLDSVVQQTLRDIEIICMDDGSTDESPAILSRYAAKDERVTVVTQKNAGPGVARNAGMARATGDFLIFLDSDDWFEPDFLECMVARAVTTGADVTICRAVEFDTNTGDELPSEWMLKTHYLPGNCFTPQEIARHIFQFTYGMAWDKLYRRAFLQENKLQYPALRNSEDLAFVYPSVLAAQKIAIVDMVFIHHRINRLASVSNTRGNQPDAPYSAFLVVKNYLEQNDLMRIYQQSFLNWAMEFLVWHVSNIGDKRLQKQYFDRLKQKWLPQMAFEKYPVNYYDRKFNYLKYLLVKYTPYPIFSVVLRLYKICKSKNSG